VDPESDFKHPKVCATADSLAEHFTSERARMRIPLRNPHHEPRVSAERKRDATAAAVLIPIVVRESGLTLLLTRRHENISFAGHICFPGGRVDPGDSGPVAAALREAHEEVALLPANVQVLGELGDYVSHSGFRIHPVVGLIHSLGTLRAAEGEVDEILEFPLEHVLDSSSYQLRVSTWSEAAAHFSIEHHGAIVAGPTVSMMMGFYEELLHTHEPNR
jgi:8-oxo-dGTP pyrophosphatase MutT (NUDIX family)